MRHLLPMFLASFTRHRPADGLGARRRVSRAVAGGVVVVLVALLGVPGGRAAATHETLTGFTTGPREIYSGLVLGPDGFYWGTALYGGAFSKGAVYKVAANGTGVTTVVSFTGNSGSARGGEPGADLVNDGAGFLWGTTEVGGATGQGTIFKVEAATGVLTTVVQFVGQSGPNRGGRPSSALVGDGAGSFWGTTEVGGFDLEGTVFKVNASTGVLTTVVDFTNNGASNKGRLPRAELVSDGAGFFWGTTLEGGANDLGTVFKVEMATGVLTTVVEFTGNGPSNIGRYPATGLTSDGAGFLWGSTFLGGTSDRGTIFKVAIGSGVLSTVVEFGPGDGSGPAATLTHDGSGSMLGTTMGGGAHAQGTVFRVDTSTGIHTLLVNFEGETGVLPGRSPRGRLVAEGGGLYLGTTSQGGTSNFGTIFKINGGTGVLAPLVTFADEGVQPQTGLVADGTGHFWGTTELGGTYNRGTLFKVDEAGTRTTVAAFSDSLVSALGREPYGRLVNDGLGFFWGTTFQGGASNAGTVFKVDMSNGAVTTLVEFTGVAGLNRGANSRGGLVGDGAGFLWGSTTQGGASGLGTIFKIQIGSGVLTTVAEFTGTNGSSPRGELLDDGAGSFWGTARQSGANGRGTVFKVNQGTGVLTTVVDFTGDGATNKGHHPEAGLVNDGGGFFWGTTQRGGANDLGTVFKVAPGTGVLTTVVELTGITGSFKGSTPLAGLALDASGNLWGTTNTGGTTQHGTVFKVKASTGAFSTEHEFTGTGSQAGSGSLPSYGSLLFHTDGKFYGTTSEGGPSGVGTVFRLEPGAEPPTPPITGGDATGAGLPAGTTFASFSAPDVGVSGGKVITPDGKKLDAVFTEAGTVLLRGQQTVQVEAGGAMGMIAKLNPPTGNAVLAKLDRRSGATAVNDEVLFLGLQASNPAAMVRKGQEVPGSPGVTLKSFLTLDGNGTTTFFSGKLAGAGVNGGNNTAIFAASPTAGFKMMVRKGQMVDGKPVKIIATLVGTAGTLAEGRWRGGTDSLGMRLTFTDKTQALYLVRATDNGPADWLRLGRTGDGAGVDVPGAMLKSFMLPAHAPDAVVFDSLLQTGPGSITRKNNRAVFDAQGVDTRGPIALRLLAQVAGPAPALTNVQRFLNMLAGQGRAATMIANSSLQGQRTSRTTIYDARQDGVLVPIARIGDDAPGGGEFTRFVSVAKPDGQGYGALISALLKVDGRAGVTAKNRAALFARDSTGMVQRLLRAGDMIESAGPGSPMKSVKSFVALTAAPGSIGAARGYDATGKVNVLVTFPDRTQAVVSIQVP